MPLSDLFYGDYGVQFLARELGVPLVGLSLAVQATALTVWVDVSVGKTLHILPSGVGQRA